MVEFDVLFSGRVNYGSILLMDWLSIHHCRVRRVYYNSIPSKTRRWNNYISSSRVKLLLIASELSPKMSVNSGSLMDTF